MASNYNTLNDLFTDIADIIRKKNKSSKSIAAYNFPLEINGLKMDFKYMNQEITEIPDYAFYNCLDLSGVNCHSVTDIGANAFAGCSNLEYIILYNSVTTIKENAFKGCDNLTICCEAESKPDGWNDNWNPDGCNVVWGYAPVETWDVSATENDSVIAKLYKYMHIDDKYFLVISGFGAVSKEYNKMPWKGNNYSTKITDVLIKYGITNLEDAFQNCSGLTNIIIPNSVTKISGFGFSGCTSLASIIIPEGITTIGNEMFGECKNLIEVVVPSGVNIIYERAFRNCSNLRSVTIPSSVNRIASYSFGNCSFLTSIIYTGTTAQWKAITFVPYWNNNTGNYTIYCTDGTIAKDGTITYYTT